jgi:hypothetical protein
MMLFYFLAGVKNSGYYSSPSYFGKVSRLVYEFGMHNKALHRTAIPLRSIAAGELSR